MRKFLGFQVHRRSIGLIKLSVSCFLIISHLVGIVTSQGNVDSDKIPVFIIYLLAISIYSYYLFTSGLKEYRDRKSTSQYLKTYALVFSGIMLIVNLGIFIMICDELSILGYILMPLLIISFLLIIIFDSKIIGE